MFHKAIGLQLLDGTAMAVTFLSGRLMGAYGIVRTDEPDIEAETSYEEGETIEVKKIDIKKASSQAVLSARAKAGLSQKELSELTGINQSDISKIERGVANPSIATLERIATALGGRLTIAIETV